MTEEETEKRVICGSLNDLPPQENTMIRVFFSSTFTDMTVDRNFLMKNSVPKIRKYCLTKNLDYQIVDYRWGVRDEASIDHSTNDIVLEEVITCKEMSRGPYFVVFLGDKYGSRFIPREIEANEYKTLFRIAMKIGCDTFLMNKWYKRDDNSEPAVYYLLPITDNLPNYDNDDPQKAPQREKERNEWNNVYSKLTEFLRRSADQSYEENKITKEQRLKYFYSVTESEALKGIVNSDDYRNRVLAYFRTFEDMNTQDTIAKRFTDLVGDTPKVDQEAKDLRERLKLAKVQPVLLPSEMKKDTLYWSPNGVDPENTDHQEYLENLDQHFEENMIKMIEMAASKKGSSGDLLYEEVLHHLHFAKRKLVTFCGREDILEAISDRLNTIHGEDKEDISSTNEDNETDVNNGMTDDVENQSVKNGDEKGPRGISSVGSKNSYFEEVKEKVKIYKERGIIYVNGDMDMDVDSDPHKNMKMEMIKKLELKQYTHPVILYGESGSGKTSIMAKIVELSKSWFPGCDTIVRFLGTSVGSSTIRDIICSVIRQIMKINGKNLPSFVDFGGDFLYVTQLFESILSKYNPDKTLVLVLDSIDQLTSHDRAHLLNWLPLKVPCNVRIIVSMLPEAHGCLQNIKNRLCFEQQFIEVPVMSLDNADLLISRLCSLGSRRVTKPQRRHLMEMFAKCSKPLYIKLLMDQALLWRSSTDVSDFKIGPSIQVAVDMFFDYLEKKHGHAMVCKTFGFLSASLEGLSYTELEDLLSLDDETLQDTYLYHLPPDPYNIRIPPSVISLLIKDLKDYVVLKKSGSKKVATWYHRQFKEVACKRYLLGNKGHNLYLTLVEYFRGTWHDKVKPLELYKKKKGSYPEALRGVPEQPTYFHDACANERKLIEYPHHLVKCQKFTDFRDEIACSFEWLYTKCKYVSVSSVIEDLKMGLAEMDLVGDVDNDRVYSDIQVVTQMLSLGFDSIRKDSTHLALQILGQFGMDYDGSPCIKKLVAETKTWAENNQHSMLIPLSHCLPPPDGYIQCLINSQVWIAGADYHHDFTHVMILLEKNKTLVALETQKDNQYDYLSMFDMNDNGSAVYSEKLMIKSIDTVVTTCKEKFSILGTKDGHQHLIRTDSFNIVKFPGPTGCLAISDKYVVFSSLTNVSLGTIEEKDNSVKIIKSTLMEEEVLHLVLSPDSQFLVVFTLKMLLVLNVETLEICYTDKDTQSFRSFSKTPFNNLVRITRNNVLLYRGIGYKQTRYAKAVDLASGKELYSIRHSEQYEPTIIAVHPSEKYFAFATGGTSFINGDTDKRWFIHSLDDGKQVTDSTAEFSTKYGVSCLKLFGSDKIFAVTAPEFTKPELLVLYCGTIESPISTAVPCISLRGHSMKILQILISSDESTLYSASQDCTIRVWNLSRVATEFQEKYSPTGKDFDAEKATEGFRQAVTDYETTTVNISCDNQTLLVGRSDGVALFKDLHDGSNLHKETFDGSISHLFVSKSGKEIIVIPSQAEILILDSQTYNLKHKLEVNFKVECAAESNSILVVGKSGMEAKGRAYNIQTGCMLKEFELLYSLSQVAINSTGTKIVATMFDFPLIVSIENSDEVDGASYENLMTFNDTMMSGSSALDISPDDQYAFSASTDGGIRVIKMTGQYFMRFDQKSSAVAACFSPDSKFIVSCGFKSIYVWSIHDGILGCKLKKHDDFVTNIKFDKSGKYLLSSSRDKKLVLWDFYRGISLASFVSHCQLPLVDISPDAKHTVFIPDDIDDVCILKPNTLLTNIIDGKHKVEITPALLGAQAVALSFSSQKMMKKEASNIGCVVM